MQTLALALHELGTNARKHGALPHALGAITTYALTETGLRCTVDLPSRSSPHDRAMP